MAGKKGRGKDVKPEIKSRRKPNIPFGAGRAAMPMGYRAWMAVALAAVFFTLAMGGVPARINVAVIPIDVEPFFNVEGEEGWYLNRFPQVLRDFADEAVFRIFKHGAQIRQVHPERYEPSQFNAAHIRAFHDRLLTEGTDFARRFSEDSSPLINVLITFQLDMPAERISVEEVKLFIKAYYFTREKKDQPLTVWHRTSFLSVVPRDRREIMEKVESKIADLVQAYQDNPRPE